MYRYIDSSDNSQFKNDETYNRIIKKLDDFTTRLPASEDKELLLGMVSEVYYKQHKAIRTKSESDTELLLSTLMAIIMEQNLEIRRLGTKSSVRYRY